MVLKNKNETEKNRKKYLNDNRKHKIWKTGKKRDLTKKRTAIRTRRPRHRDQPKIGRQDTHTYRILYPKRHPKTNIFQKNDFQDHSGRGKRSS